MKLLPESLRALCLRINPRSKGPAVAGVYFCVRDGRVLYTGQSSNVAKRCYHALGRLGLPLEFLCREMPAATLRERLSVEAAYIAEFGQPTKSMEPGKQALFVRITKGQRVALEEEARRRSLPVAAIIREMVEARYQSAAK